MVLHFNNIQTDHAGNIKDPTLIVQTMHGETIGTIGVYSDLNMVLRFTDSSELSMNIPRYYNGDLYEGYDIAQGFRTIVAYPYGVFYITSVEVVGNGVAEYKSVSCTSIEYDLEKQNIVLAGGTYKLYDTLSNDTICGRILEIAPTWQIQCDPSLYSVYRTFDDTDEHCLSWLRNTAQASFGCLFQFDLFTKTIYIIDASNAPNDIPVYLSYDNMIKEVKVTDSTDNMRTALSVHGADPVSIRTANPTGQNVIYNLDYFIENGDIPSDVATVWRNWETAVSSQREPYMVLQGLLAAQVTLRVMQEAELVTLKGKVSECANILDTRIQAVAQGVSSVTAADVAEADANYRNAVSKAEQQQVIIQQTKMREALYENQITGITDSLRFDLFMTQEQRNVIEKYIIEDAYTDDTFASYDTDVTNKTFDVENVSGLYLRLTFREPCVVNSGWSDNAGGTYSVIGKAGTVYGSWNEHTISGDIFAYSDVIYQTGTGGGNRTVSITMGNIIKDGTSLYGGTLVFDGASFSSSGSETSLIIEGSGGVCYSSMNTSDFSTYGVEDELYRKAVQVLADMSKPTCEFDISSANMIFAKEFLPFRSNLQLGAAVYIRLSERTVLRPVLLEVSFSFDEKTKFSMTFSTISVRSDRAQTLKGLLDSASSSSRTLDYSKYNYGSYAKSGAESEVRSLLRSGLDAAAIQIASGSKQSVTLGDDGITVKSVSPSEYIDGFVQANDILRINNGMIAFIPEGSQQARIGIGRFYADGGNSYYGVLADNIVGKMIAGEQLTIQAPKVGNSPSGWLSFTLDGNGAKLCNSQFDIIDTSAQTQISIHPTLGLFAGRMSANGANTSLYGSTPDYLAIGGSEFSYISPDFYSLNDTANQSYHNTLNFWIDKYGSAYFRGTIYATSGVFSGTLSGTSGVIGGWNIGQTALTNGSMSISPATGLTFGQSFNVSNSGVLTATGANISGTITASSGRIGSWTVGENGVLENGSLTTSRKDSFGNILSYISIAGDEIMFANMGAVSGTPILGGITARDGDPYGVGVYTSGLQMMSNGALGFRSTGHYIRTDYFGVYGTNIHGGVQPIVTCNADSVSIGHTTAAIGVTGANVNVNGTNIVFVTGGYACLVSANGSMTIGNTLNQMNLYGSAIYSNVAIVVSSDVNKKRDVSAVDDRYVNFFGKLTPKVFKYNDGTSGRLHTGFVAQDVKAAIESSGLTTNDFAAYVECKDPDGTDSCGLRYEEFVALNTYMIQRLQKRVEELEEKIRGHILEN